MLLRLDYSPGRPREARRDLISTPDLIQSIRRRPCPFRHSDRSRPQLRAAAFAASAAVVAALGASGLAAETGSDVAAIPEQVTFSEHVAPIFYEHCVTCHRPNDVAPMSLLSYDTARPWAKSIAKVVVDREMPPWDADPRYGDFANDISLDEREIAIVKRWVELGAPEGDRAKLPAAPELPPPGSWKMGRQPDYVIELAAVDVPAGGPDLFVTQIFGSDIPAGKWVQAIELLPGNTDVLHHVVTYLGPFGMGDDDDESNSGVTKTIFLNDAAKREVGMAEAPRIGGVWVAGAPPSEFPTGHGQSLAAGELFSFNMHYHPSGNAGTDSSKLGIYFGEGELVKEVTTAFAADPGMFIPAGAADHREDAVYLFARDSLITSLLPHMHNRGKSMKYTLVRPDGSEEILLDVPKYDYNWQNIYRLREPIAAPAGSIVKVEAHWNNSDEQPGQPRPQDRRALGRRHQQRDAGRLHRLHRRHRGAAASGAGRAAARAPARACTPPTSRSSSASRAWASASSGAWWCRARRAPTASSTWCSASW